MGKCGTQQVQEKCGPKYAASERIGKWNDKEGIFFLTQKRVKYHLLFVREDSRGPKSVKLVYKPGFLAFSFCEDILISMLSKIRF